MIAKLLPRRLISVTLSPPGFYFAAERLLPWLFGVWVLLFGGGMVWGLFVAPPDYQQGDAYRIIFAHVPAAWMSLFIYTTMAVAAALGLIWKFKVAEIYIAAAAPVGAWMTALTLATGSIWGKPMWGAWWVWDARLTSELILLFLYAGVIALRAGVDDAAARRQLVYIVCVVGFVNVPIIHYSVEWWATLHQPASILKFGAPSIAAEMLAPLLVMAAAFKAFFLTAVLLGMQNELLRGGGAWVGKVVGGRG